MRLNAVFAAAMIGVSATALPAAKADQTCPVPEEVIAGIGSELRSGKIKPDHIADETVKRSDAYYERHQDEARAHGCIRPKFPTPKR